LIVAVALLTGLAGSALAITPGITNHAVNVSASEAERIATLERQLAETNRQMAESKQEARQQVAEAKSAGDNAWILTSAALVLFMTAPGLALFYGGLVRKKNVLSTMMHSFAMMVVKGGVKVGQ